MSSSVFTPLLILVALWGCEPADPVSLSTVHFEFGERGTLFYNQAQRVVERGQALDLSLQLPIDVHFSNGSDWHSVRVLGATEIAFGPSFEGFISGDSMQIEVAGADEVVAVCNHRFFRSEWIGEQLNEQVISLPAQTDCTLLGLKLDGRFPTQYELRTIPSGQVTRVVFQPISTFEQTLRVGFESSKPGYLESFLTLEGYLTDIPLGEGGISNERGLVVLSPQQDADALGIWLRVNERTVSAAMNHSVVGAHIDRSRVGVLLDWPAPVAYSSAPGNLMAHTPWTNTIGFAQTPPDGEFQGRIRALTGGDLAEWSIKVPLTDEVVFPERPFATTEMYRHVSAAFDLVWSSDDRHRLPITGDAVPGSAWLMQARGYFRSAQCDADASIYGHWSSIETCELETPRHSVLIDECGVLIPFLTTTDVASGRLDGDRFIRENGTVLPVEMNDELSLDVGRGATAFNLLPDFESGLELPDEFQGVRGTIAVTEQVYEFQDGAVGFALNDEVLVLSARWQTVAPYQGTGGGKVLVRSDILNVDLSLISQDVTINGLELARQIRLCPDYEETFFLRERDESIVLEQLINQVGQQTVLRRLYTFD
jgi:hypothetical protein